MSRNTAWDRLGNMPFSLGARIFLGFGVMMALLVIQATIGVFGFDHAVEGFKRFERVNSDASRITEVEQNVLQLQRNVMAYTQTGYEGVVKRVHQQIDALRDQLQAIKGSVTDEERQDILRRMTGHFESYSSNFDVALEDRRRRDRLMEIALKGAMEEINRVLTDLISRSRERKDFETASLAGTALEKLLMAYKDSLTFVIKPRSTQIKSARQYLSELQQTFQALNLRFQSLKLTDDHRQVVKIQEITSRYEQDFTAMVQTTQGYMDLVYVVMAGESWEFAYLAKNLKELTAAHRDAIQRTVNESIEKTQNVGLVVSSLAALLGMLLAWLITRNISGPVKAITRTLTDLARGRDEAEIPGLGRQDEIGSMAKAAQVFREKADALENASQYKSDFLANMSHELRTPLNSMLILSKMLTKNEAGNLTGDQVESASVIHESGKDLLRLINDILDLSKIEAGRMDVMPEEGRLDRFARGLERLFNPVASNKGLTFSVEVDPRAVETLYTDWAKVEQILRNFLSNAFKFTAEGGVKVRIHRPQKAIAFFRPDLHGRNTLALAVQDTGIGISPGKQEQIFEAFRQGDGTTSRRYGGTGLGLSISRRLAELLGGEIQVDSQEGKGATFSLYLPLKFPSDKEVERYQKTTGRHYLAKKEETEKVQNFQDLSRTVLVVDDDQRNIFALKQVLQSHIGQVLVAGNGQEALDILGKHANEVDLVFMDIMMPIMDGFQAMQAIRRQDRFRKLPILALTAKVMPEDRDQCMVSGASDYLSKPIDHQELLAALSDWLDKPRELSGRNEKGAGKGPEDANVSEKGRNHDNAGGTPFSSDSPLTFLIVDDDMHNTFSLAQFLQKKGARTVMAQDGEKALLQLEKHQDIGMILMDVVMPNLDGWQATRKIRENPRLKDLPIVAMIDGATSDDREKCLESGMTDCLAKPIDRDQLMSKLSGLLNPG